jgi:trimeric autotransporter adhesin
MKRTMNLLRVLLFLFFSTEAFSITISGGPNACIGIAKTLSIDTAGGTWSISDPARATIVPATGVLTGLTIGTATISYTVGTAVFTAPVLIYPQPGSITGTASTCSGISTTLSSSGAGSGVWSSSNTAVATIGTGSGVLTGVAAGTTTITFTRTLSGCFVTRTQTVLASPAAISGASSMCVSTTQTLTGTPAGGTWTRSNAAVANIGASTGVLNALVAGSTNVVYTLPGGCNTSTAITVVTIPATITGYTSTCVGNNTTLASATSGGTWTAATPSVATIGSTTGIVTGTGIGTSAITYTMGTGCSRTATVTVNAALASNTGSTLVCVGQTTTLSNASTGGTWSSSNTAKATVGYYTGVVSAVSSGTSNITYSITGGCRTVSEVTVNSAPASITGATSVCVGDTTMLSHTISGGTWSSSNTTCATINTSTGVVSGIAPGYTTITYTISSGCYKTMLMDINALPAYISGTTALCTGSGYILTNGTTGGTWSSSNTAVATIGSTNGLLIGISTGTATISYKITSTGCFTTITETVNTASAGTISGPSAVTVGGFISLSNTISGGTWTSSAPSVATVSSTGYVAGVTPGTATIIYNFTNSCGTASTNKLVTAGISSSTFGDLISATNFGGDGDEHGYVVKVDNSGNIYVAGRNTSSSGIATAGAYQTTYGGGSEDGYIAKFNGSGTCIWATYFGGENDEACISLDIDESGNVYVVGRTESSTGIATTGTHQPAFAGGGNDGFLAKFNSSGTLQWSTYYGGSGDDKVVGIAVSGSGSIYITGATGSTSGIATTGGHQTTYGGGYADSYIAKFSETGILQWATYCGGYGLDEGTQIVNSSEDVYVSGFTASTMGISTTGSHQPVKGDLTGYDAFLVKFDTNGVRQWGTFYGGESYEWGYSVDLDGSGNVFLAGHCGSTAGIATAGAHQTTPAGSADGFLAKFNSSGVRQWGTYFGGTGFDVCNAVSVDGFGNVYVAGETQSLSGIATADGYQPDYANPGFSSDAYLIKFGNDGSRIWGSYYGGNGADKARSVYADDSGNVYISGLTQCPSDLTTCDAYQVVCNGSSDAFIAKFGYCFGAPDPGSISGSSTLVIGDSVLLHVTQCGGTWESSNDSIASVGLASGIVTGNSSGFAIISYSRTNECGTATATYTVSVTASRSAVDVFSTSVEAKNISIFPNPSTGLLNISSGSKGKITIYSVDGRVVTTEPVYTGTKQVSLPADLARGIYLVKFIGDNGTTHTTRIVLN